MLPKVLRKGRLEAFVAGLMERYEVVGPKRKPEAEQFYFAPLEEVGELRLGYPTTLLSPKKYFQPQEETLLRFDATTDPPAVEPVTEAPARVIFGVHPCDINALWLLDAVFSDDPQDVNFLGRRQRAMVAGLNCLTPCDEHAFCADMGTHEAKTGYDLLLTDLGEAYFIDSATERGQELVGAADLPDATNTEFARLQEVRAAKASAFAKKFPFDTKYLPDILEESWDSLIWEATGRRCFSCGACNMVCPTCYCFNVFDAVDLSLVQGERQRVLDGCMLEGFARVAGGENFRSERGDRLRHRIFRKGKYLIEKYGRPGCVGCGRCDRVCLVKISSQEIYTQIAGSR
jgi:sulfhydrogenase subunit beta (sulfur reductase)